MVTLGHPSEPLVLDVGQQEPFPAPVKGRDLGDLQP